MGVRFLLLLLAGWLAWPAHARADGKVFSQVTAVKTVTPDQRALLHLAGGTETLVVETTFVGAGTNFAWVVPLPGAPEITAVPRTVFMNLERLFQPEVIHKQTAWWVGMLIMAVLLGTFIRSLGKPSGLLQWFVLAVLFLFLLVAAIPGKVKGRGLAGLSIEPTAVQILARQTVGVFDTVTLSSPDGAALTRWLNDNGFAVPAAAAPVIADYAKAGWVFAAAKLSRPDATGKTSPHPLAFKFKTDRAVYPLRLTGVENDRCLVELYVFGESRAELPGFKVEQCLATEFPKELPKGTNPNDDQDRLSFREPAPGQLRIRHPALRSLVAGSTVGTKLTGTLDAAAMSHDAYLAWAPFERQLPSFYSHEAACIRAMNLGVAVLLFTLPCVGFWLWRKNGCWTFRLLAQVVGCAMVVGMVYFVALPKIEVRVSRGIYASYRGRQMNWRQFDGGIQQLELELRLKENRSAIPQAWNVQALLVALEPYFRREDPLQNIFTGEPLREEATPGNLLFRPTARGTEVLWHDVDCVEHLLATLPTRAP
ncbi:MAG: hypothetical protein FD161_596 [Limisphaerales bacterium]|nr:MAG: hypothetical protein FD161_596 [Limisphaerales bacterium]KAG0510201.1 MAG: hypothetical protein E1N63_596 [Limisphaerales bacterium]TXT51916.1 MAG: hypothetical protein FD140_1304 [Limisphaerales bacterium]